MKYKENPGKGNREFKIVGHMRGNNIDMENLVMHQNKLHNFKVSFSNYYDADQGICRLCRTKCLMYTRAKDGDKFLVNDVEKPFPHRIWSKSKKLMFCQLPDRSYKIALGMSRMRDDPTEKEEDHVRSKKSRLLEVVTRYLTVLSDEQQVLLNLPPNLQSLSSLRLEKLLDEMREMVSKE